MKRSHKIKAALAAAAAVFCAGVTAQQPDRLTVSRAGDAYVLAVPVSRLEMAVPAGKLVPKPVDLGGSTSSPRYFQFSDPSQGLILSGWFEPSAAFKGLAEVWEKEQAAWKKRGLPAPMNVSTGKVGPWETVFYEHPFPDGLLSSHVRAHLVQSGTWIDLHISVTAKGSGAKNRAAIESILESIAVTEKPGA
jgi:hypothetical protein